MSDPQPSEAAAAERDADPNADPAVDPAEAVTIPTAALESAQFADQPAVDIDRATKRFGDVDALDEVSIEIPAGTFHVIAGPNGSGKTTLGRAIAGLCRIDSGSIRGVRTADVGFSFQQPRYYPTLSVDQNLDIFRRLTTEPVPDEWLAFLERTLRLHRVADRQADAVSGGFKKKLDIAITLLTRPPVIWLDEPLADIDELSERRLIALLDSYRQHGATVIVSTHNIDAFESVMTHLTVMADARLCQSVDTETLSVTSPANVYQDILQNLSEPAEDRTDNE